MEADSFSIEHLRIEIILLDTVLCDDSLACVVETTYSHVRRRRLELVTALVFVERVKRVCGVWSVRRDKIVLNRPTLVCTARSTSY